MNDWLESGFSAETGVSAPRPDWIILAADSQVPIPLSAALARVSSTSADYFFLVGLTPGVTEASSRRLLALSLMDHQHALLQPTLMPPRPPLAVLRSDATLRQMVTRTFSPWVLREIDRIGEFLQRNSPGVLKAVTSALNGRTSTGLQRAPTDFPLQVETDTLLALPLAELAQGVQFNNPPGPPKERHHHVRSEYERDRYLAHLPLEDVLRRGNDIVRNLHEVDPLGRVTLDAKDPRLYYWMDRFTEYIHELGLRGVDPRQSAPHLLADIPLPTDGERWPGTIGSAVSAFALPTPPVLVRYGEVSHVRGAWERGAIRLGPASSYDDASLDPARRDDELALALDVDGTVLPFVTDGLAGWKRESPRLSATAKLQSNFLVYCLSSSLKTRLFMDFDAKAALVIRDPDEFRRRFERAVRKACPEWRMDARAVTYYDPLNTTPGELKPPYWKHFRYAYQEEVRFVLLPPRPIGHLDPLFIQLGSLEDISDPLFLEECAF